MSLRLLAATAALFFQVASAAASGPVLIPCRDTDAACAHEKRLKSPIRSGSFWKTAFDKPVTERLGVAPEELLVYLNLDNIVAGVRERPRAARITPELMADIKLAVASIPAAVWKLAGSKLAGIHFVENLGGTALSDYVKGGWFAKDGGFIVLDTGILAQYKANEWATWKENTPFIRDATFRLEAAIENDAGNTRANAIRYILLHEIGHIVSVGTNVHPVWDAPPPAQANFAKDYPFAGLAWRPKADRSGYESVFDAQFRLRKNVVYYFGAQLHAPRMVEVYASLESTNFPTLYAATSPGDDFAESFASYVHTVLDKRPWEIRLSKDGSAVARLKSCWDTPRCREKRLLLDALFARYFSR
ncbi:MAG: hypothetical protein JNJ55_09205 [Betaproteobacteria bacterium]|nr:hypothetical protein [Betaproteobacteria bacterium]